MVKILSLVLSQSVESKPSETKLIKSKLKELNAEAQKIKVVLKSALVDSQTLLESFETDPKLSMGQSRRGQRNIAKEPR